MITRFRLEASGMSKNDCTQQLEMAALALIDIDGGNREDWEITDDVSWMDGSIYRSRIVMKLKGKDTVDMDASRAHPRGVVGDSGNSRSNSIDRTHAVGKE